MKVESLDALLAAKVINVTPGLRQSDRQVAVALIEHFNRRTGQCDPSLERMARLLGYSQRTIMRATERLARVGLFRKVRHGGYSNRNSYEPNWERFEQEHVSWTKRLHPDDRAKRTQVSPQSRQNCHLHGDSGVTQTYSRNLSNKTYSGHPRKETGPQSRREPQATSSADVARTQAERRWSDDLLQRYRQHPITYGEIIERIDDDLASAATSAELSRRGSGLHVIQRRLKLPVE